MSIFYYFCLWLLTFYWVLMLVFCLSLDCPWWLWLIVMMIIDCFWWLFFIEFWLSWMIVFESYVDCLWLIAFNDYFLIEFFIVFDDCVWELCWLPLMIVFYWVLIILDDCVWELCWSIMIGWVILCFDSWVREWCQNVWDL